MSSSQKFPSDINVRGIKFFNGGKIGESNIFESDVHLKKRLRVDGDISVTGNLLYTDDQTGWGLPEWTYATSGSYNKYTDSLIVKMKYIENNYATKQYVNTSVSGPSYQGFSYYDTGLYPQFNSLAYYPYPVTTLTLNAALILRDDNVLGTMALKIQQSNTLVGNVLTCMDSDGTVGWAPPSTAAPTVSSSTVITQTGNSNNYSFRVIDTGISGTQITRGLFVYPDIANNTFNKAILARDFVLLGGKGQLPTASGERTFIGPFSYGSEGISFKSTFQENSIVYPGKTRICGGYYDSITGLDQSISLEYDGIKIMPAPNTSFQVGTPSQPIQHNFYGNTTIQNGVITLKPLGNTIVAGYILTSSNNFGDGIWTKPEYTGAKNFSGSYTNANITIDADGKISAISSNAGGVPSTVTNAVTFQSHVTFSNSFSSGLPIIPSGGVSNYLIQSSSTGQTTWSDSVSLQNVNTENLQILDGGINSNDLITTSKDTFAYTPLTSETFFTKFNTDSTYQTYYIDQYPYRSNNNDGLYNNRYYWETAIATCTYIQTYIDNVALIRFTIPVHFNILWHYRDNKESNNENMKFTFAIDFYWVYIYNSSNGLVSSWKVNLPTIENYRSDAHFRHQRYVSEGMYCQYSSTGWRIQLPIRNLDILWTPPTGSIDTYTVKIKLNGIFNYIGEFVYIPSIKMETNLIIPSPNIYGLAVYSADYNKDIYADIQQYASITVNNYPYATENGETYVPLRSTTNSHFVSTNSTPDYESKTLCLTNTSIKRLLVSNSVHAPNGYLYSCGIGGRKGVPTGSTNYDSMDNSPWSYKSWGNIFNFFWTTSGRWQVWVDSTLISDNSPNYSDYRIKDDILPINSVLDKICTVPVISYKIKKFGVIPSSSNHIGILAHELQETFPEYTYLVNGAKDVIDKEGSPVLQTLSNEINFLLMKAIQELKIENDLLKARIDELFIMYHSLAPT